MHLKIKHRIPNMILFAWLAVFLALGGVGFAFNHLTDSWGSKVVGSESKKDDKGIIPNAFASASGGETLPPSTPAGSVEAAGERREASERQAADTEQGQVVTIIGMAKLLNLVVVYFQTVDGHQFDARDISESFQLRGDGSLVNRGRIYRIGQTYHVDAEIPVYSGSYGKPKYQPFKADNRSAASLRSPSPTVSHLENGNWVSKPLP